MSKIDFTPETVSTLLDDAEQLSLSVLMLLNQSIEPVTLKVVIVPLLDKLNADLQQIQLLTRLHQQI